jgi:uncharacterized protein (DUF1800 family)
MSGITHLEVRVPTLTSDDAHHLMRRAGFGATAAQAAALVGQDRATVIESLLTAAPADAWAQPNFAGFPNDWERWQAMRFYAYDQMAFGASPLVEKLALFWHGHFCCEEAKCGWRRMWPQYQLFRQSGRGDLRQLTKDVSTSVAMLVYLDNQDNVAGRVQENFARELWELFLLGPDQYTQEEIVASAKAWTGHRITGDYEMGNERYVYEPTRHDDSDKTIFGVTAKFNGPDVIDTTFARKASTVANFIAAKLWSFFAWPVAADSGGPVTDVANALKASWNITDALRALFNHSQFWSTQARQGLVKTPIEFQVSLMKATGLRASVCHPEWGEEAMGQQLFNPPNVAGWKPNAYWLSATAFYARNESAQGFLWRASDALRRASGRDNAVLYDDVNAMTPAIAASTVLARVGVANPSAASLTACTKLFERSRATRGWGESLYATRLAVLTPEFNLA